MSLARLQKVYPIAEDVPTITGMFSNDWKSKETFATT